MYNFPFPSAISTGRDSIDLISRLDRSHFPFPSAISTDRDSIVSFPICSATRSISFRDSTDLISHFPFQCNFQWPRLDSIINLISQSMMTQNQGNLVRIISGCRAGRRATRDVLEIFGIMPE